jgi:hypothetical protein
MTNELSPALKNLAKWCAVLSIVVVVYPLIFMVPNAGYPFEAISDAAQSTTHTHLAGNLLLFFMVGFLFCHTSYDRAKKIWPAIGAVTLILALLGLFFGLLPLIIVGYSVYAISILVMAVGILIKL